ncbi:Aminotransferase class-III [Burkholderia sp. GAS332]|nr:Aminotransferase class-III [Burkholderia sp. GAS332]
MYSASLRHGWFIRPRRFGGGHGARPVRQIQTQLLHEPDFHRANLVAITNGFHGMSSTSLGLTGNRNNWQSNVDRNVFRLPYEGYLECVDSIAYPACLLDDNSAGARPARRAVILETVQREGGISLASAPWLRHLRALTDAHGILLIVDDIQLGFGRTGDFLSFAASGIVPDLVCLSKPLSGYGLPFSLLLHAAALDLWNPGEDNRTFRGSTSAFVTATAALQTFWADPTLSQQIRAHEQVTEHWFSGLRVWFSGLVKTTCGRGLIPDTEFYQHDHAKAISQYCFANKMITEHAGGRGQIVNLMPAPNITAKQLRQGLATLEGALHELLRKRTRLGPWIWPVSQQGTRSPSPLPVGSPSPRCVACANLLFLDHRPHRRRHSRRTALACDSPDPNGQTNVLEERVGSRPDRTRISEDAPVELPV